MKYKNMITLAVLVSCASLKAFVPRSVPGGAFAYAEHGAQVAEASFKINPELLVAEQANGASRATFASVEEGVVIAQQARFADKVVRFVKSPMTLACAGAGVVVLAGYHYIMGNQEQEQVPLVAQQAVDVVRETEQVAQPVQGVVEQLTEKTQQAWDKTVHVAQGVKAWVVDQLNAGSAVTQDGYNKAVAFAKDQYKQAADVATKYYDSAASYTQEVHTEYPYLLPSVGVVAVAGIGYGAYQYYTNEAEQN